MEDGKRKTSESAILTRTEESGERISPSSIHHQQRAELIEIDGRENICSVAFLGDGKHAVSGGLGQEIRRWRIEDGEEVGTPMDAGSPVCNIAVSRDGKWVVSGTSDGRVTVWNAENHSKVTGFNAHSNWVRAVDVSPDGTRIATGSKDKTACVWSLSTGERLVGPLEHDNWVAAVKFSPDACLLAAATQKRHSLRIYHSQDGRLLVDFPVEVNSTFNQSLAWASDSDQLFALSLDGDIHCLDVYTGVTLSKWPIHSSKNARCIALANNNTLIAASAGSSVSFWNTTTREQIGSVIEFTHDIWSMAISVNYDLAVGGERTITFRGLCDIRPVSYPDSLADSHKHADHEKDGLIQSLRAQEENSSNNIARLEKTVQELRDELAKSERAASEQKDSLHVIMKSLRADLETQETSTDHRSVIFEEPAQHRLSDGQDTPSQEEDSINETIDSIRTILRARDEYSNNKFVHLEQIIQELRIQLVESHHKADRLIRIVGAHEQGHKCEALYDQGRIYDAVESLLEMTNTADEDVRANNMITNWLAEFTQRCVMLLERVGDEASNSGKPDEAATAYSTALSLSPSTPNNVLMKWATVMLIRGSSHDALNAAAKFKVPRFLAYRSICDILERDGYLTQAVECFRQMQNELQDDKSKHDERVQWELDFRHRCVEKLEKLGDTARESTKHDEAIRYYSHALSLDPTNINDIGLKQCTEVIELDPSSHRGYEGKHANFIINIATQPLRFKKAVEETIRDLPRVLMDTVTGRLYDKTQQAAAFEQLPIYDELRSSMTTWTRLDDARIRREVEMFYRYVMLSHKWQPNELTFQMVENTSIYGLPATLANSKVQRFCELVRSLDFQWAWSDTCCVNQLDKGVQQESLVAMFRWYRGSSLTVVHLLGVLSKSQKIGCLWNSIWNTRGWTYQEYVASEVVQFYTEDWKPYLGLNVFNHKESPVILSEMERAMNLATQELAFLQPGLEMACEKLYLASMRQTTRVEDIAYSLFGIFNVALPVIYGEGNQAAGRLLEHILMRSADVTLLAWAGNSGSHHSYLPADLTFYNQIVPPHVPPLIETAELDGMVTVLRSSLPDLTLAIALYNQLYKLPSLSLVAGRLGLPGIVFPLANLSRVSKSKSDSKSDLPVYRATSPMLGDVEIKTKDQLSGMRGLVLIHPWIGPLLDQDFSYGTAVCDLAMRALRLVVRLKQPFGALLLAPLAREQYKRIATDSLIMVQVREETLLDELMDGVRTVDIQ
ncbi:WD40 repeat-like protein [Imleria badia]|nr:WD40 repeat-like protein [Imleria badia]